MFLFQGNNIVKPLVLYIHHLYIQYFLEKKKIQGKFTVYHTSITHAQVIKLPMKRKKKKNYQEILNISSPFMFSYKHGMSDEEQ